jgi:hypothetical protein
MHETPQGENGDNLDSKKRRMNLKLKLSALALLIAAPALTAQAQTNLLQAVTVGFTVYSQGAPVTNSSSANNVVDQAFFGTKDLIRAVSASGTFNAGDVLARATTVSNGALGTASWVIYNKGTITPISTNVYFDVHTDDAYGGTDPAYVRGVNITGNHVIKYGTTDEIRTMILSNSAWQIKLVGYARGHEVPVSLGGSDVVYSQDYNWSGSGSGTTGDSGNVVNGAYLSPIITSSGTTTDSAIVVMVGDVTEGYFKFMK